MLQIPRQQGETRRPADPRAPAVGMTDDGQPGRRGQRKKVSKENEGKKQDTTKIPSRKLCIYKQMASFIINPTGKQYELTIHANFCKYIQIRHCPRIRASFLHGLQSWGLSALALPNILGSHSPMEAVKALLKYIALGSGMNPSC